VKGATDGLRGSGTGSNPQRNFDGSGTSAVTLIPFTKPSRFTLTRNTRAGVLISSGRGRIVFESASHSRTNFILVVILALTCIASESFGFRPTQKSLPMPTEHMMPNVTSDGDHVNRCQIC